MNYKLSIMLLMFSFSSVFAADESDCKNAPFGDDEVIKLIYVLRDYSSRGDGVFVRAGTLKEGLHTVCAFNTLITVSSLVTSCILNGYTERNICIPISAAQAYLNGEVIGAYLPLSMGLLTLGHTVSLTTGSFDKIISFTANGVAKIVNASCAAVMSTYYKQESEKLLRKLEGLLSDQEITKDRLKNLFKHILKANNTKLWQLYVKATICHDKNEILINPVDELDNALVTIFDEEECVFCLGKIAAVDAVVFFSCSCKTMACASCFASSTFKNCWLCRVNKNPLEFSIRDIKKLMLKEAVKFDNNHEKID